MFPQVAASEQRNLVSRSLGYEHKTDSEPSKQQKTAPAHALHEKAGAVLPPRRRILLYRARRRDLAEDGSHVTSAVERGT